MITLIRTDGDDTDGVLLNIFGGKITTYRVLAEEILKDIENALGARQPAWTAHAALPGGDFPARGFDALVNEYAEARPRLDRALITRLVRHYGTRALIVLGDAQKTADLGKPFGNGLFEAEVVYLMRHEWAVSAEDVLFRRTKLGIAFEAAQTQALQAFMDRAAKTMDNLNIETACQLGGCRHEGAHSGQLRSSHRPGHHVNARHHF